MPASPSERPIQDHPLLRDRARLDEITGVMYLEIQKVLYRGRRPTPRRRAVADAGDERTLTGGESADDVLQEATLALLRYPESELRTTWEGLSVRIAQNKAIAALRRSTKGRRRTDDDQDVDDRIRVVPLAGDEAETDLLGVASDDDLDREYALVRQQQIILRLARELLNEREQRIFFDVHHLGVKLVDVGRSLGLSGQRVGQIYRAVAERLLNAAYNDREFHTLSDFTEKGGPDDRVQ